MGGAADDAPGDTIAAQQKQTALLAKVLRVGVVLDFLPLSDVVLLLTACSAALRNDVELTQAALLESSPAARHGRHLLQECWDDWFELVPKRIVGDEALATICCDTTHYEDDDPGRYMRIKDPVRDNYYKNKARYPKGYFAQLLSVVGAFDKFILPACADKQLFLSSYGDYTATIPMTISLWDYYLPSEHQQNDSDGSVVWTRDVVRAALNAVHAGFGDRFLDDDRENAYVSQFGAHWDSIRVTKGDKNDSYEASCELCNMRKIVVKNYEAQVQKQQEACNAAIAELMHQGEEIGEPQGVGNQDELDRKIEAIERQFFPEVTGGDDDPYLQEDVEDVLEHVINSERVQFPPFPAGKGLTPENLFGCLQDVYGYPVQCRSVSQPLKRFFTTHCKFASRIKYDWLPRQAFATSHAYRCTKVELVGGVTPSGFFCGAFVVILQTL